MIKYLLLAFALTCTQAFGATVDDKFLDALALTEHDGKGPAPAGDGGKSIGPYQIGLDYWKDAISYSPSIGGTYQDCLDKDYARLIVKAYMGMWASKQDLGREPTYRDFARIHNGGPKGYKKGGGYKATSKKGIAKEKNLVAFYKRFRGKLK